MLHARLSLGTAMFAALAVFAGSAGVLTIRAFAAVQKDSGAATKVNRQKPASVEQDPKKNENIWEVAWGKPVDGLRAGISFRLFEKPVWHFREAASFVVYLQNTTQKNMTISYPETLFRKSLPTVLDVDGRKQETKEGGAETTGRRTEPRLLRRELAAGEIIEFAQPWLMIYADNCDMDEEEHEDDEAPSLTVAPGKYRVCFNDLGLRWTGKTTPEKEISTGEIEFEVKRVTKP